MKLNNIINCIVGLSISIVVYVGFVFANNDSLTDQQKIQAYNFYYRLSLFTQGKDPIIRDNIIQSLKTIAITFTDDEKKIIDYFFEIRQYVDDVKKNKNLKDQIGLYRQQRLGQHERQAFASIQRCVPYMDLMTYFAKKYPASFLLALWRIENSCSLILPSNEKGYFQINSKRYNIGTGTLLDLYYQVEDVENFIDQKFNWYNTVNQSSGYHYDFDHYVVTGNLMHTFGALYNGLSGTIYTDLPQPRNLHYLYGSGNRIGLQQHYRDIIDRQYVNRFLVD